MAYVGLPSETSAGAFSGLTYTSTIMDFPSVVLVPALSLIPFSPVTGLTPVSPFANQGTGSGGTGLPTITEGQEFPTGYMPV